MIMDDEEPFARTGGTSLADEFFNEDTWFKKKKGDPMFCPNLEEDEMSDVLFWEDKN